jgi:hypothetical protein
VSCIDRALRGYGRYGIAEYWSAMYLSMLSKEGLAVHAVYTNLTPFLLLANAAEYRRTYSFAMINMDPNLPKLDESLIENTNGLPEKTIVCGHKKLLIYPKHTLKIPFFIKKGDQFTWAAELPSASKTTDHKRIAKVTDTPSYSM